MRKLVSMREETFRIRETVPALGISRDLDIVATRSFKGKYVKGALGDGTVITGKVDWVVNGGFRGIEVHVITAAGRRIVTMDSCRVWGER